MLSCNSSESVEKTLLDESTLSMSFEDQMEFIENPSVASQLHGIRKNGIRKCKISKWERNLNNESLELQGDYIISYYNKLGCIDSIINPSYDVVKISHLYDEHNRLRKRSKEKAKWPLITRPDSSATIESIFHYDSLWQVQKESIQGHEAMESFDVNYSWSGKQLNTIDIINSAQDEHLTYQFEYKNGRLTKRHLISKKDDQFDKTNEFIYKNDKLIEITNTWILAHDLAEQDESYNSSNINFSDLMNTKFEYDERDRLIRKQRVTGMWPGESFWVTTYRYFENGLLREKELNNSSAQGDIKIIYKYEYD
ncbi:MAG: hypothetical protein AAF487_04250 [Bacteroidota bacterium]